MKSQEELYLMERHQTLGEEVLEHLKETFPALANHWAMAKTGIECTATQEELKELQKRYDWEASAKRYEPDNMLTLGAYCHWRVEIKELFNANYSNVSCEFREYCLQRATPNTIYCIIDRRFATPRYLWRNVYNIVPHSVNLSRSYGIPTEEVKSRCLDLWARSTGNAPAPRFNYRSTTASGSGMPFFLVSLEEFKGTEEYFEKEFGAMITLSEQAGFSY